MSVIDAPAELVRSARELSQTLLAGLPRRWRHTIKVAQRAEAVSVTVGGQDEADLLVAAAWLHDIGYATALRATGFHPLDGARYLHGNDWPDTITGLVAHHSAADHVAQVRGLAEPVAAFPNGPAAVADALTYADQTIGPDGRSLIVQQRFAEMLRRHGPDSPNAAAHPRREPALREMIRRVDQRLTRLGQPTYS